MAGKNRILSKPIYVSPTNPRRVAYVSPDLWQPPMLFRVWPLIMRLFFAGNGGEIQWCFSQVKGTVEEDVTEGLCGYHRLLHSRESGDD